MSSNEKGGKDLRADAKKKIGFLGGSFNPPHLGHVAIAQQILEEGWVDQVWVVPCWEHPFDKKLIPFQHRFEMSLLAFAPLGEKVEVLEVEKRLGGKSYTLRTIQHLKRSHPEVQFFLILGQDAAQEVKQWYRYEELKESVEWLTIPRGPQSTIPNVSASVVRKALRKGESLEEVLPKSVIQYIQKEKLYQEGD